MWNFYLFFFTQKNIFICSRFYYCTSANALDFLFVPLIKFNWASSFFLVSFEWGTTRVIKVNELKGAGLKKYWAKLGKNYFHATKNKKIFRARCVEKIFFKTEQSECWKSTENTQKKHSRRERETSFDRQVIFYKKNLNLCVSAMHNVFFMLSTPPIFSSHRLQSPWKKWLHMHEQEKN